MDDERSFQRFAGVAAIVAAAASAVSLVLFTATVGYSSAGSDAVNILKAGPGSMTALRWSMFLQMLGYYLLLVPVALALQRWLGSKRPSGVQFYTICGFIYIVTGALATSVYLGALPDLVRGFAAASGGSQDTYTIVAKFAANLVTRSFGDIVSMIPAAVWWIGLGLLIYRGRRALGVVSLVLGAAAVVYSVGSILDVSGIMTVGLLGWFILIIVWSLWLGIILVRKPLAVGGAQVERPAS
jgi:hypothetical protein